MATLLKRVLFFVIAATLVRAAPAMSVPLASTIDRPAAVSSGSGDDAVTQTTDPSDARYSPFRRIGGGSDGSDAEARIVGNQELAYGPMPDNSEVRASHPEYGMSGQAAMRSADRSSGRGWVKPVAAVGAGSSLYALFANKGKGHGKGGNDGLGDGGSTIGGGGNPGDGGSVGGDTPPIVNPEPGTLLLMGLGIAGYLKSRRIVKK